MSNPEILKQQQVEKSIKMLKKTSSEIHVSNFCYQCFLTGKDKEKTLIILPDELETKGIITIDKPLVKVEMLDIIKLYKKN